ncbi:hypothetical protein ACN27F_08395 [Solwaraspora sp. WMMB335]|uniref:hypothetical protein n=1 Tax=Solwaraspora sp. WMMB335 TaxID=3404118 RepID=UPI003B948753
MADGMIMDVGAFLARLLATPVSRLLDVHPEPGQSRSDALLADVKGSGGEVEDLLLRHLTRATVWFVAFCIALPVTLLIYFLVSIVIVQPGDIAFVVLAFLLAFVFFVSLVHALKVAFVHYTPESWWRAPGNLTRWLMLSQLPDFVVAGAAAVLVAFTIA